MWFLLLLACPIVTEPMLAEQRDQDGDGFISEQFGGRDCNDDDEEVFPNAPDEYYDGLLQDCGRTDDFDQDGDGLRGPDGFEDCNDSDPDTLGPVIWFVDEDGDGLGDPRTETEGCDPPAGSVQTGTDCDDLDASVRASIEFFVDQDGDGAGDPAAVMEACEAPNGTVDNDLDCDDADAEAVPGRRWFSDADGDGFGDAGSWVDQCKRPTGGVVDDTDCDDTDGDVFPGSPLDVPFDGVDSDCAGDTELDSDGDGLPDLPDELGCPSPREVLAVPSDGSLDIQDVIDVASDCAVVEVPDGVWRNFTVDKRMAVVAAPGARPWIVATPLDTVGAFIDADVTLEGLVFQGFPDQISVGVGRNLLGGRLELTDGGGIFADDTSNLVLMDLHLHDAGAGIEHLGEDIKLERCRVERVLAPLDIVSVGTGRIEVSDCLFSVNAPAAGVIFRSGSVDMSIWNTRFERNVGAVMELDAQREGPSTVPLLSITDVSIVDNVTTAPFLVKVDGDRSGKLEVSRLFVEGNQWLLPPGSNEAGDPDGGQDDALVNIEGVEVDMMGSVFRGNEMVRDGASLRVIAGPGLSVKVFATQISGDGGMGIRMDNGLLQNVTLVGLEIAVWSDGVVAVDSSILAHNVTAARAGFVCPPQGGVCFAGRINFSHSVLFENGDDGTADGSFSEADPMFLRYRPYLDHALWDLRPLSTSPAINGGNPDPTLDDPEPRSDRNDAGSFGGPHSDPLAMLDSDEDGLYDSWEVTLLGTLDEGQGGDGDGDNLSNLQEHDMGTLPMLADTDGDGVDDKHDDCPLDVDVWSGECTAWSPGAEDQ